MSKLTAVQIRQAKPCKLPDGQGLYFHVAESGKSTWRKAVCSAMMPVNLYATA
ncbi:Arm DNA-binding domain-containing protein [Candidatus Electronema sp. JC]|jgi:hypothetical protein|uniref:Arm DNA-binding domain-containing protein n=1 Tax=Candidatus Electronema sp. JC TaxID=3401570 RepID=UPI003B42F3B8